MKMDYKLFLVTEKVHGKVLEIRIGPYKVKYFPMLVNEQAFLRIINPMDS